MSIFTPVLGRRGVDTAEAKRRLRVSAAAERDRAHAADGNGALARAARDHFLKNVPVPAKAVIGGYWPVGTELDVRPLLGALHERGHVIGLPRTQPRQALVYHRWSPDDALVLGRFGILMPNHERPVIRPDVLILPMLAFDRRGLRVGYGGGYSDRTMAELRARGAVLCVGFAYAAQEVERVPADQFDERLDWIVTEREARRIERRRFPWLRRFLAS